MSTDTPSPQESTGTVTGPHDGRNSHGDLDHRYWRCERCGLETTDQRLREGCFRCSEADPASNSEVDQTSNGEQSNGEPDPRTTGERTTNERAKREKVAGGPPDG